MNGRRENETMSGARPTHALVLGLAFLLLGGCAENQLEREVVDDILGGRTVNDCETDAYEDLTSSTSVTITDIDEWTDPHSACIVVSAGTAVTWQGDFDEHPLVGGETPTTDTGSPITQAMASGTDDVVVTFNTKQGAAYPYFCTTHPTPLLGVIVVVP